MADIIKFNTKLTKAEQFSEAITEDNPEEIVAIAYKDGTYFVYSVGEGSITRTIGAMEIIKHELLTGEWE